jgi:hypothetical protein
MKYLSGEPSAKSFSDVEALIIINAKQFFKQNTFQHHSQSDSQV